MTAILRNPRLQHLLTLAALSSAMVANVSASEQLPDLFLPSPDNAFAATAPGEWALRLNDGQIRAGARLRMHIPGVIDRNLQIERLEQHTNGDTTWIGQFDAGDERHRLVLTRGIDGARGTLRTPEGEFLMSRDRVQGAREAALAKAQTCVAELPARDGEGNQELAAQAEHNEFAAGETEIDVLVLHTPGLGSSPSAAQTIINQIAATANQAYLDSGVNQRIRIVHIQQVNYSDTGDNDSALDALSDGTHTAFANIETLRTEKGADLVALVRPYKRSSHGSCGVAWLNGGGGQSLSRNAGYSVTSYGMDGNYYCDDYTFAHELGHNMGSAHDLAHTSQQGAFSYSYGYGFEGSFGTIMSYIDPLIGRFSSPSLTCAGQACGTSSANNALSLNNTRLTIAAFTAAKTSGTSSLTAISISPASIEVGASATITPAPTGTSLGTCASSNTTVATVNSNSVTGVGAGTATITCGTVSATVTVTAATNSTQIFGTQVSESDSSGRISLSLGFTPEGADIGKSAEIYIAARIVDFGQEQWFLLTPGGWSSGLNLIPLATRTLGTGAETFPVLAGEFTEAELIAWQADLFIGYRPAGTSLITYDLARSYR